MCGFCVSFSRWKFKSLQRKLQQPNTKNYANGLWSQCATKMKHNKRRNIKAMDTTTQTVFHWKFTKEMRSVSSPSTWAGTGVWRRWFFLIFFFYFIERKVWIFSSHILQAATVYFSSSDILWPALTPNHHDSRTRTVYVRHAQCEVMLNVKS